MAAITIAALAGLAQRPLAALVAAVTGPGVGTRREHASWLPYLAVGAGGALLILAERHARFFPNFSLVICVGVLMTLVSARQFLANRDLERSDGELRAAHDALSALATTDSLTGLPNHRGLVGALDSELERSRRYDRPFGLLFLDLDRFKAINDSLGHCSGDEALKELGRVISSSLHGIDILPSLGGARSSSW